MSSLPKLDKHTIRLSLSYLAIIMILSLSFSVVFYKTSTHEVGRQLPPQSLFERRVGISDLDDINQFFLDRISEARHALLIKLVVLNFFSLAVGSGLSYYLARRSLEPIEEAMEAQARFSSDASHELRTPLTAIRTRNEVSLRKPKLSLAEARKVIESNLAEIIKLENLSDGLLKLAKQNGHESKPVNLNEVVARSVDLLIKAAQVKHISFDKAVPKIKVFGDVNALSQALATIIDNAIKYSPANSTIFIEAGKAGKQVFVSVRDEGPGISATDLTHIFDRFYRADNSRTKPEANGYGLGLAIAKSIIEQHDGEISVESTLGKGSIFVIKLPGNGQSL